MRGASIVVALFVSGCALDWTGSEDLDAEQDADADADQERESDSDAEPEAEPEADVADQADDTGTETPGDDGTDDAGGICIDECNPPWNMGTPGICDDGGPGAGAFWCDYGTDCVDCGPRPPRSP